MISITSRTNPRFKYLKSLSKSRQRKKQGVFLLEGREELDMAKRKGLKPKLIAFCPTYVDTSYIESHYDQRNVELLELSKALFDDLTYQNIPDNYIALFDAWEHTLDDLNYEHPIVLLEGLEKPGNLGAVLRSCSAAGVTNIIVSESQIDLFNPNVIRNSRGAFMNTNVVFTSNAQALQKLEKFGYHTFVTSIIPKANDYQQVEWTAKSCIVFGSESQGVTSFWSDRANTLITIPMHGDLDSLNLSVSVGIILFNGIKK